MQLSYTKIQCWLMFFILLLESVWISFASFTFMYDLDFSLKFGFFLSLLILPYLFYKQFRPDPRIVSLLESLVFIILFTQLMVVASFLFASLNFSLIDNALVFIDSLFIYPFPSIVMWFRAHPEWDIFFAFIYNSFLYQFPLVIFYFSARGKVLLLQRFVMQFMIASCLTALLSGIFPALGPYVFYGYTPSPALGEALNKLLEIRQGIVNISVQAGIVTFPSFHVIMALIYIYTFRGERTFVFIPIVLLNLLLIFSCLPIGQHYFADLLGAIPVFVLTIWLDNLLYKYVVQKRGTSVPKKSLKFPR